mgnify:CR=1 FL=1
MRSARCLFLIPFLCLAAFAQQPTEDAPKPPDPAAMMARWVKMSTPKAEHKWLQGLAGEWETESSLYMAGPDQKPQVSKGKATANAVMGGRYVRINHTGSMMGMPMQGECTIGFDNYMRNFTMVWIDTLGTATSVAKGHFNQDQTAITFYGQMDDWSMELPGKTIRYTYTLVNPNELRFDMYDLHAGPDYKVITVTYRRPQP